MAKKWLKKIKKAYIVRQKLLRINKVSIKIYIKSI